jgi:hypothetical protein
MTTHGYLAPGAILDSSNTWLANQLFTTVTIGDTVITDGVLTDSTGLSLAANVAATGTLTIGTDGSGTDVIFYSGTAGDNLTWDASEEKLTITGTNGQTALDVADGNLVVADFIFINDTAHGVMNRGLVVNEGAGTGTLAQSFALKSSDVATGMSSITTGADVEADDYFTISKISDGSGGVRMQIMAETGYNAPFLLEAWGGDPATTDTADTMGCLNFFGGHHDGSNADVDMQANASLLCIGEIDSSNNRKTRLLLKADDGELHLGNTTLVALDAEDDVQLVRAMQRVGSDGNGLIESRYDNPFYDYNYLKEKNLAGEMDADGFFLFPLQARMHAHEGAMWQTYVRVRELEEKLAITERKLAAIGAA